MPAQAGRRRGDFVDYFFKVPCLGAVRAVDVKPKAKCGRRQAAYKSSRPGKASASRQLDRPSLPGGCELWPTAPQAIRLAGSSRTWPPPRTDQWRQYRRACDPQSVPPMMSQSPNRKSGVVPLYKPAVFFMTLYNVFFLVVAGLEGRRFVDPRCLASMLTLGSPFLYHTIDFRLDEAKEEDKTVKRFSGVPSASLSRSRVTEPPSYSPRRQTGHF